MDDEWVPVRRSDIVVGRPMPWSVYDSQRNLLLRQGVVINSMSQVDGLLQRGLYRTTRSRPPLPTPEMVEKAAQRSEPNNTTQTVTLDEMRLSPGDMLQLQPQLEGSTEKFSVRLIGYARGRSLLVSAPEIDGKLVTVRDGQTFRAGAFSGVYIGTFNTKVLKCQFTPYPYLHLAYPAAIQATRLRKSMRAPAHAVTAIYAREDGPQVAVGVITDISVGGARIESAKVLGLKDEVIHLSFKIKLSDFEEYIKAPAVIRSVTQGEGEDGQSQYVHGVQFEHLEGRYQLVIANLVYRHLHREVV